MSCQLVLSPLARADIVEVLAWSITNFGGAVCEGYEELINAVFRDICENPMLAGSHDRPELGQGFRVVHLSVSRHHVPENIRQILEPRHVVFYRRFGDAVHVSRVLHESRDFSQQRVP